jgi:serine/threonine-protein kinase
MLRPQERRTQTGTGGTQMIDLGGADAWSETVTTAPDATVDAAPLGALRLPPRYRDQGRIAAGGFGEIRRVHDLELDRVVAMKLLRADVAHAEQIQVRFLAETRLTAGLEHPGIVSVHDGGRLADGRLWFTMREVRGRTFGDVIDEVHAAAGPEGFRETSTGWTFRRLVDAFARVCQAVAYAHRRGIVHRDLKPDNLMVGELGEALVMDWGLGRRVGARDVRDEGTAAPSEDEANSQLTRHGDVLGTPAYMPPEQARGQRELHGLPSDVYALGAVLYCLLSGRSPYEGGSALVVLRQVLAGPPLPIALAARGKPVPAELATICDRAMQREMSARYPDAEALAREVADWLDGARRTDQALEIVARADRKLAELHELHPRVARLKEQAALALDAVASFEPVEAKKPGWALEDESEALEREAELHGLSYLEDLRAALNLAPELQTAHDRLADYYQARHTEAETRRDARGAESLAMLLRTHDIGGRYGDYLRGDGSLSIVPDPPDAELSLYEYTLHERRLVPVFRRSLGRGAARDVALPMGSYLVIASAPGRVPVRYPVHLRRQSHWDGVPPSETETLPIVLPRPSDLDEDDIYVPAGWFIRGGDPRASYGTPWAREWEDAFFIKRSPVTNIAYIEFLNDLVDRGRKEDALRWSPQSNISLAEGAEGHLGQDAEGHFFLTHDTEGDLWLPDWPAIMIHWGCAVAYAGWLEGRTGRPWGLLQEDQWEKAARGVDGRFFPWGDFIDPTWCCIRTSHPAKALPALVSDYPTDESPYGVRGMAGNVRDWCADRYVPGGGRGKARVEGSTLGANNDAPDRVLRGGSWFHGEDMARLVNRNVGRENLRESLVGMRVGRAAPWALRR